MTAVGRELPLKPAIEVAATPLSRLDSYR